MRAVVTLGVLGLTLSATAEAPGQPRPATYFAHRPVFALAAPGGWLGQHLHSVHARAAKRHAPNPAFAGYAGSSSAVTDLVAHFKVPGVACAQRETAIGPGAFLLAGPPDRLAFNSANIIVGCYRGTASAQEAIEVNGVEFDYVEPVQSGDRMVAQLKDSPGGQMVVALRDLNPRRRFDLTRRGRGSAPEFELVGDWASADAQSGAQVPPPDFEPTSFRSITVSGKPFGSASPTGYDMASSRDVLQIKTGPLRGPAHSQFTCRRRGSTG